MNNIYRVLLDSIPDGILLIDEHNVVTYVNESAVHILGKEAQELIGNSFQAVFPSLSESFLQQELDQVETFCTISRQGLETVLALKNTLLEDIPPQKRVITIRDATAAQASHQLQSYFIANVTHEFRSPLSALKASVELMLESLGDVSQSELERLLRSIHYSVAGLQTLIDNLLESANVESGHFHIHLQEARLSEVIGNAVHVMSPLLQRREQGLQIETYKIPAIVAFFLYVFILFSLYMKPRSFQFLRLQNSKMVV